MYDPMKCYVANARFYDGKGGQLELVPADEADTVFSRGYVPQVEYQQSAINIVTGPFNGKTEQHIREGTLELVLKGERIPPSSAHLNIIPWGCKASSTAKQVACLK